MAKGFTEIDSLCRSIVQDAGNGVFKPVYLLMGEEPYYVYCYDKHLITLYHSNVNLLNTILLDDNENIEPTEEGYLIHTKNDNYLNYGW